MSNVARTGLRIAGLLAMAIFVAHCGDSSVHIRTGGGTSPTAGTFTGFTDQGGALTIEVGSIEAIAFDCDGTPISETFSPPKEVNADGTFEVTFSDAGRKFHVSGRFSDNDNVDGIIDDEDNQCDTGFQASRQGGTVPTRTATPGPGATPTVTPVVGETETPTGGETETPGPTGETPTGVTATPTPSGAAMCPTLITFTGTSTTGVLDTGWTGQGHDSTVISDGTVTVSVTSCANSSPPCGVCNYTGPVANATGQIQNRRCSNDSAIPCTSSSDCSGGTCKFFFGTYLPLAAGGVSTCVENTFNGSISGTANIETGASAGMALLTSRVFSGPTVGEPCPRCVGDGTANDGVQGGTCSAGDHVGAACDINGTSPNTEWGSTSLDCPPLAGGVIATLPIDLSNTTGSRTKTLSASSPSCSAAGFASLKCQCDTCGDAAAEPCASDAECPSGVVCGGKRCIGGANNGTSCTVATECPGTMACNTTGSKTQPNQCDDSICTNGTCAAGPFDTFCEPVETFRGCTTDAQCTFAGDKCTGGKFRPCFDSGMIGNAVVAQGHPDVPSNHESDPTLAALFCIGPTTSGSVNSAAGLPGLGRLELAGHATDNGTP